MNNWVDWNWERHAINNLMMEEFRGRVKLEWGDKDEGKNRWIEDQGWGIGFAPLFCTTIL